jgi:hypothetical protein
MLKQWLESADWSKMAGVWPKYESLITDLQPPAFSPFETMALMGIALVFAPDGQPSQTRLP